MATKSARPKSQLRSELLLEKKIQECQQRISESQQTIEAIRSKQDRMCTADIIGISVEHKLFGAGIITEQNATSTISREFGSGGRTIGKKVAEQLGISCYDAELIQKLAKESGFAESYIKEAGEYTSHGFLSLAFSNRAQGPTNEDILWDLQYKVITELAEKGPCVIVGRCADYILREKADCLNVFIHADMAFRAERIVNVYGEREQSPEQRIRDKDKRRAAYHRFYTDMKWGHAQNYHITLNSGVFGIDRCVEIICGLF